MDKGTWYCFIFEQFALLESTKACNRAPIIQTLGNINIQSAFLMCEWTVACFKGRINVTEGNAILFEEPHQLNGWMKTFAMN
jgi:hypothetical protein